MSAFWRKSRTPFQLSEADPQNTDLLNANILPRKVAVETCVPSKQVQYLRYLTMGPRER